VHTSKGLKMQSGVNLSPQNLDRQAKPMQTIRTTNWNNFNKFTPTKPTEPTKAELKARIVRRFRRRFQAYKLVAVCGRRFGKTTSQRIILTNWFSLCKLESALVREDSQAIKKYINQRINCRGGLNGFYSHRRTS
jgi:hypothetical protein